MHEIQPPKPPPLPTDQLHPAKQWQFSLRTMMLATTGFAVFCSLVTILPRPFHQAILGFVWLVVMGWLVTGIIFAKGDARAFCIGAAIVASSMWTRIGGRFVQGIEGIATGLFNLGGVDLGMTLEIWINHFGLAAAAVANGYLCIRARRYFEQQQ